MKHVLIIFSFLWIFPVRGQVNCNELSNYIPRGNEPAVVIKIKLHVIQYSAKDPRNYTLKDTSVLKKQIDFINEFFATLEAPTLQPPVETENIQDSRIRFVIRGIHFYVDSLKWDRIKIEPYSDKKFPLQILEIKPDEGKVIVTGNHGYRFRPGSEAHLSECGTNSGKHIVKESVVDKENKLTIIKFDKPLEKNQPVGKVTYYYENNHNCDSDLFNEIAKGDKRYLHIFYTGSSMKAIPFGCGPSPYFLNVSNYMFGMEFANAQLSAHELGHCMGLNHTDYPQFDDLPRTDKFGFIDCDTISVSNNIMGYNKCRRYLSPKQIAHIHKEYSTNPGKIITTIYCDYDPENSVDVNRNETWNRSVVIGGDLIIRKNKTLTVTCMVSLPDGGKIILEDNAKIIVNGGTITNNCGGTWDGILLCRKFTGDKKKYKLPKKKGRVEFLQGGKFENMKK